MKFLLTSSVFIFTFIFTSQQVSANYCTLDKNHIKFCSNKFVCMYAQDGEYQYVVDEAKKRKINCGYKNFAEASLLQRAFISLSKDQRIEIQSVLTQKGYYKNTIDGLFGISTATAIKRYRNELWPTLNLDRKSDLELLLSDILVSAYSVQPKASTPSTPSDIFSGITKPIMVSSGTGFFVSNAGHLITNFHVVEGCSSVKAHISGKSVNADIIANDMLNDLAVLKISEVPSSVIPLSNKSAYPLQDLIVAGYPFGENLSSTIKFTKGIVSSLAGIGNNYSQIQIDAAIQPGNSGGPILDSQGNAIAVAVSKLSVKHILDNYGVIPENINFGIKMSAVKNLLEGNNINYVSASDNNPSKAEIAQNTTESTVYLTCWMEKEQIIKMIEKKYMFERLTN